MSRAMGPPAAASSALALAQLLQERAQLQQMSKALGLSSLGNTAIVSVVAAVSALLLAICVVGCLITYQPKPDYSETENEALRTSLEAHNSFMRTRQQPCAC
ncbi:unnamed protein product [Effrenium voratum]|nr:unnamed protein product [Effrenium voratum]